MTCYNCGSNKKTFVVKNYAGEKGNDLYFCSNKCHHHTERADKIPYPKLDPSSKLLYTIKAGTDAYGWSANYTGNRLFTKEYADKCRETREIEHRHLSKAILKTSKKPVKAKYTHNEGALPKEWR